MAVCCRYAASAQLSPVLPSALPVIPRLQAQSARVVGERDRAVWEGEELKAANLRVCAGWRDVAKWVAEQGVHC